MVKMLLPSFITKSSVYSDGGCLQLVLEASQKVAAELSITSRSAMMAAKRIECRLAKIISLNFHSKHCMTYDADEPPQRQTHLSGLAKVVDH
jgi:hypothetical protein